MENRTWQALVGLPVGQRSRVTVHLTAGSSWEELGGTSAEEQEEEYPLQDPFLYLLPYSPIPKIKLNSTWQQDIEITWVCFVLKCVPKFSYFIKWT